MKERLDEIERRLAALEQAAREREAKENDALKKTLPETQHPQRWAA